MASAARRLKGKFRILSKFTPIFGSFKHGLNYTANPLKSKPKQPIISNRNQGLVNIDQCVWCVPRSQVDTLSNRVHPAGGQHRPNCSARPYTGRTRRGYRVDTGRSFTQIAWRRWSAICKSLSLDATRRRLMMPRRDHQSPRPPEVRSQVRSMSTRSPNNGPRQPPATRTRGRGSQVTHTGQR